MNFISKLFLVAIVSICCTLNAQEFSGIATYKSHRKIEMKMEGDNLNDAMKKQIYEQIKKQSQKTYFLSFNREESLYKQEEVLSTPKPSAGGITVTMSNGSDVRYKNIKEQRYTSANEIFGKAFLIKDSINPIEWKLVNETKNIGNYTCFKAEFTKNYTDKTFTDDGKLEDVEKEKTTTAWYTPQIPLSHGPEDFQGLPGLILEINDGELTLICSKIVLNPEKKVEVKEPSRGKEVSQSEYDAIVNKKMEEQMEDLKSRSRNGEMKIISFGD
ncbi:GLPGLI family protein [Sediminibacter sp. Hel_I_10]|uniref:GLPGLI family protein n=1 Tax=Sediminibacter sp. Hel_I_10 TaxID=1392490 RepID=UPI000479E8EC|nr:GLPGLI family protein [Sediminibacter sp. Hel_I_10]